MAQVGSAQAIIKSMGKNLVHRLQYQDWENRVHKMHWIRIISDEYYALQEDVLEFFQREFPDFLALMGE